VRAGMVLYVLPSQKDNSLCPPMLMRSANISTELDYSSYTKLVGLVHHYRHYLQKEQFTSRITFSNDNSD